MVKRDPECWPMRPCRGSIRRPDSSRASAQSHFRTAIGASLGRAPGPAFERMIECAGLAVAEKPRDLGDRQIGFSQIALGEIEAGAVVVLIRLDNTGRQSTTSLMERAGLVGHSRAALVEQKGDSVVWPDNAQFKQAWLTQPVYRSMGAGRVQYALREIDRYENFEGLSVVLAARFPATITPLAAEHLADLAIASLASAESGRDGITYLIDAERNGIVTPLSAAYEKEILRRTETADLTKALFKLRAECRILLC